MGPAGGAFESSCLADTVGRRGGACAMRLARLFPYLARGGGLLAGPFGLTLGLFHPLAGPLELFFGNAHALPGNLRLQPRALQRLSRRTRGGGLRDCTRRGSICSVPRAGGRRAGGSLFAGSLPHAQSRPNSESVSSVTQWGRACHPGFLSTDFVNNPVHTVAQCGQSGCRSKGLRQPGQRLSSRRVGGPACALRCRFAAARSARASGQHRGGDPVAAAVLAAIERRVGHLQYVLRELTLTDRHAIEPAQAEARRNVDIPAVHLERLVGNRRAQLARDIQRVVVGGFGQDNGEFLAADARHPVDAAAQRLLQARAKLLQNLVAASVTERVVGILEEVDVTENEGQRPAITRRAFHLAWEVLAEEPSACDAGQIVRRGELAILNQCDAQNSLELRDPARCADPRVELTVGNASANAVIGTSRETRLSLS